MAAVLSPVAHQINTLISLILQPIHSQFPSPILSCMHAARVALVYRMKSAASRKGLRVRRPVDWRVDLAGYLIMAWGGSFVISFLLSQPPPQLLSPLPLLTYSAIFLLITPSAFPSGPTLDMILPLVDSLLRSVNVTSTLMALSKHPNVAVRESVFFHMIIAGLATGGGGLVASTFDVFSGVWSLQIPPLFSAGWLANFDFIVGVLSGGLFSLLSSPLPFWSTARTAPLALLTQASDRTWYTPPSTDGSKTMPSTPPQIGQLGTLEARAMVVIFLTIAYAMRAGWLNYGQDFMRVKGPDHAKRLQEEKLMETEPKKDK